MLKLTLSAFGASLLALGLIFNPAQAQQPTRVFVAAQGSNANACSFALPCRTFQRAHDVVAAGGEIDVLDPAGYGALTITKAISIQGHDFSGLTVPSGGFGITISAGVNDKVSLRGLIVDGAGSGVTGIRLNSAKSLIIEGCVIRNVTGTGLDLIVSAASNILVNNTSVAGNGNDGIHLNVTGSDNVYLDLSRVGAHHNANSGIALLGHGSGSVNATLSDSEFTGNGQNGVFVQEFSGLLSVMLNRSVISNNGGTGLFMQSGFTLLAQSTIAGNGTGYSIAPTAFVYTAGDNNLFNNHTHGSGTITQHPKE